MGSHRQSSVVIGSHRKSSVVIGSHWRSTQINPRPVYIIKEALWVGRMLWMGWLSKVVGSRSLRAPLVLKMKLRI